METAEAARAFYLLILPRLLAFTGGARRCYSKMDDLEEWQEGAPLEVLELADGGRRVRPVNGSSSAGYSG